MSTSDLTGVTNVGFVRKVAGDIQDDIADARDDQHGQPMRRDPRSVAGQNNGVVTGALDALWKVVELLAKSRGPRSSGALLDEVSGLTETVRKPARASTLDSLVLTGTAGTVVTAGKEATSADGLARFALDVDAPAFVAATAWAATSSVALGAFRAAAGGIYVCLSAGTTGTVSPSGTERFPITYQDGGVTWAFCGPGAALASGRTATCTVTGPLAAPAHSVRAIGTSVSGWAGCTNLTDALVGRDVERDDELRIRRKAELHAFAAKATPDAIRGDLLKLLDVTECQVAENVEHVEVDGIPPHAVEPIVEGSATGSAIGLSLLRTVPAGIKTHGNTTVVVSDELGVSRARKYTDPTDLPIYIKVLCEVVANEWPSELLDDTTQRGSGRVVDNALAFGRTELTDGRDFDPRACGAAIFAKGDPVRQIPGLLNCQVLASLSPSPTLENRIAVTPRQRARLDSARIDVVVTAREP